MKMLRNLLSSVVILGLVACGGDDDNDSPQPTAEPSPAPTAEPTPEPTPEPGDIVGPFSTGSASAPAFVYYDLDAGTALELTEAEAEANDDWDIAFRRTNVYLNFNATTPVVAYFTNNNSDFYDTDGEPVVDRFVNATAESELEDFTAVTTADIPADEAFSSDAEELIIGGAFYSYDMQTHTVSAADDQYFIVQSDGNFSKIRAKSLTTAGRTLSELTLGIAFQNVAMGDEAFMAEQDVIVDAVNCEADLYIDLDTAMVVEQSDDWDVRLPCVTVAADTGAGFEMHIADDASATIDSDNSITGVDPERTFEYSFESNIQQIRVFDEHPWYEYSLQGNHLLWSQYGVYLIKTATATYKLQIVSYYNNDGTSGNYSFRYQAL